MRRALAAAVVAAALSSAAAAQDPSGRARPDCGDAHECRQRAVDAAERGDYESFHDLAWRAVQAGNKDDTALMFLLARAQSLSGRPHDALVMLRRLAPSGSAAAALTSADFERVRALREWPELQALLTGDAAAVADAPSAEASASLAAPAAEPAAGDRAAAPAAPMTFAAASLKPAALAYDGVSRRFIVSDTDVSRLAVVDEFSRHLSTLASGRSAGFGVITAVEIDPGEGDLWVASVDGSSGADVASLHKFQLISGRVLKTYSIAGPGTGRVADIAVAPDGAIIAIGERGQIFRLGPDAAALQLLAVVTDATFTSVTISPHGVMYLAGTNGVLRSQPAPAKLLDAPAGVDLKGLARIRWSRGSLIGVQNVGEGSYRVVRVRLSRDGRAATAVDVLDPSIRTPSPAAATLAGDAFYYLVEIDGPEVEIRRHDVQRN